MGDSDGAESGLEPIVDGQVTIVTIKSGKDNKYCRLHDGNPTVQCDLDGTPGPRSKFRIIKTGTKVALQSRRNGKFCADTGNELQCNSNTINAASQPDDEKFTIVDAGGGKTAFKTQDDKYCADEGTTIKCNRNALGPWDDWTRFQVTTVCRRRTGQFCAGLRL